MSSEIASQSFTENEYRCSQNTSMSHRNLHCSKSSKRYAFRPADILSQSKEHKRFHYRRGEFSLPNEVLCLVFVQSERYKAPQSDRQSYKCEKRVTFTGEKHDPLLTFRPLNPIPWHFNLFQRTKIFQTQNVLNLNNRLRLLMSPSATFRKSITLTDTQNIKEYWVLFLSMVPLPSARVFPALVPLLLRVSGHALLQSLTGPLCSINTL